MNGNTIFQTPPESSGQSKPAQNQGAAPSSSPQGSSPFAFRSSRSPISPRGILKVLIVVMLIVSIGYIIYSFGLPLLRRVGITEVTLTYWGLWEEPSTMQSVIAEFNRDHPNIKINYSKQDHKQYRERLVTRIQNGTGPDIFRYHNTWIPMLSDVLAPLPSDVISRDEFGRTFYPVASRDLIKNGAIYGIPLEIDTLALFINKDIFDSAGLSAPKDWIDFINYSRSLTVKDSGGQILTSGAALGAFNNINHAPDIVSMLLVQNGVDLNNIEGNAEEAAEALGFYASFVTAADISTWNTSLDPSMIAFSKGNVAMYFGYSWDYFTIKALNPGLVFEIHPVPQLQGQNATIASYWVEGVSAKSQYQQEALLFLKFLAEKETAQKFFSESSKTRAFGEPYARIDLADSLKDNPIVYPFVSQGSIAVSSFFSSDTHDNGLNSQMNTYLGDAVNAVINGGSPQSAVVTLTEGVNQVKNQYSPPAQP
ncbi:MAG: hypothetical protein ACD_50C00333G0012 [uncultured bacterium]|nr:MAG: hypothetical protein ACD_50C00333G0012 [uncultured bacterium]OGH13807.1 MAG: hypothetical protein A2687_03405 [Candidatus Levybacteria bacterium RIFCSPHIGHO2_01_FULL_38_26]